MLYAGSFRSWLSLGIAVAVLSSCQDSTGPGDSTRPTVLSTSPANGGVLASAVGPITVTFSKAMDASTINGINLVLRLTSNGAVLNAPVTYNATTHVATLAPVSVLSAPRMFTVTISSAVKDTAGNAMSSDYQFAFNTGDGASPTVIAMVPANGKIGATIGSVVQATFSEPMDPSSFGLGAIQLTSSTNGDVSGAITYDAATKTATFTPTQLLREANVYTARVNTGVRDVSGLSLDAPAQWTFTTVDNTSPRVSNVTASPMAAGSSTLLELNATFLISFTEPIQPSTLNASTFFLREFNSGAAIIGGFAPVDSSNQFWTFKPGAPLTSGTRYVVTVTTGVKDLSGNSLEQEFSKQDFFTTATPDTIPPTVVSTSPVDGETGIRTNGVVTVIFNESVSFNGSTVLFRNATTGASIDIIVAQAPNFGPQKFIITPRFELDKNTRYTVTLTNATRDIAGNSLIPVAFSFTTAP